MALAIDQGAGQLRVLHDLSGRVVGVLLDDAPEAALASDPFAAALLAYTEHGQPAELGRPWRRAAARAGVRSPVVNDRATNVLRHLARDLLECVATPPTTGEPRIDEETPPPNVRPLVAVPALELANDGTWRPSESQLPSREETATHRPAHVPSLGSRYPGATDARRAHVAIPPAPLPVVEARVVAPPPPAPRVTAPAGPPPAPHAAEPVAPLIEPAEERVATSAESVIQAVSGALEIVAGPFDRFQQLAGFVKALRGVRGVQEVTTRQFVRGTVTLRIRYSDPTPFSERLGALAEFAPEIVSSSQKRIELRVRPPEDVPPARQ